MNNGKSRLIPGIEANLLSAIVFFCCAASSLLNRAFGWLAPITLILTVILFFLDSNSFVRKCSVQTAFFYIATLISSIIIGGILGSIPFLGIIFDILDWLIRIVIGVFALISGFQALNGNRYNVPFIGKYIDTACSKLGVF